MATIQVDPLDATCKTKLHDEPHTVIYTRTLTEMRQLMFDRGIAVDDVVIAVHEGGWRCRAV